MAQRQRPEEEGEVADEALQVRERRAVGVAPRPQMHLRMERQLRVDPRRQLLLAPVARRRAEVSRTGPAMERSRRDS